MGRPSASARARRLIALLSRLEPDTRMPLSSLANQLGVTVADITADLTTLSCCGVAPYDPFGLVPVLIDGDEVEVFGEMPALKGPVRLSTAEAEALAAALQAAGFEANDPLTARLLAATTASYPAEDIERVVRASISGHDSAVYEQLARAVGDGDVVRVDHASATTGEVSCRTVEPFALFAERGAWYLTAWCRVAGGWRTFRLDRIRSVSPTGEHFDPETRGDLPTDLRALDTADLPCARLRFSATEPFSEREWPGAAVVECREDGSTVVDVPYAGTAWLARHVAARLGAVEVVEPPDVRDAVAALAAAELASLD